MTANVTPENATNKAVTWESSNESVATVSNGVITAKTLGTTTITATTVSGGYSASCKITVIPKAEITDFTVNVMGAYALVNLSTVNVPANATIYLASYNNGKMSGLDRLTLNNGSAQTIIPVSDVTKLKLFIWNVGRLEPITEYREYQIN